jgi:hypothetical protein
LIFEDSSTGGSEYYDKIVEQIPDECVVSSIDESIIRINQVTRVWFNLGEPFHPDVRIFFTQPCFNETDQSIIERNNKLIEATYTYQNSKYFLYISSNSLDHTQQQKLFK